MTNLQTISAQRDAAWSAFLTLALFAGVMLLPSVALADTPIADTLCTLVEWMTGTTGKAVATLAIIIIGVGALMGKVSWGMAIIVALGIAIVFGAEQILELLDSGDGSGGGC
jgi:type IV secretory pathway VirB2 component (pilin)